MAETTSGKRRSGWAFCCRPSCLPAVLPLALLVVAAWTVTAQTDGDGMLVYIGTYTREDSRGIYAFRFDPKSGEVTSLGLAAETSNPSFLAVHPNGAVLYAVSELSGGGGAVTAFAIDRATGTLRLINQVPAEEGPCHLSLDPEGKSLLVANYGSGSVMAFLIGSDFGLIPAVSTQQHHGSSIHPRRQQAPHAHSVAVSPDSRFVVAADLGTDQLWVYRFEPSEARLTPSEPPFAQVQPGAGPRHFTFHPNGLLAYVINELQSTVTAFTYRPQEGRLEVFQTVTTLPAGFSGENHTAEVLVHPSGRFLYGSNRGHDSIAVFSIDPASGRLTPLEHVPTGGRTPRNFNIDPSGTYLFAANQNSHNVVVFRIDAATGRLTSTGRVLEIPSPVCVKFVP